MFGPRYMKNKRTYHSIFRQFVRGDVDWQPSGSATGSIIYNNRIRVLIKKQLPIGRRRRALLQKEPSVPVKNVLRYRFCNRYPETGTNVTV